MSASPIVRNNQANGSPLKRGGTSPGSTAIHEGEAHGESGAEHGHGIERGDLVRIGFVVLAAVAVWFRIWEPFPHLSVIGIVATLIGGYPIFKEAVENIVERKMTMELSMTIALLAALAIGEFFTALVITGFVLVAEVLEGLTVGRGRTAIRRLVALLPARAVVRRHAMWEEVATDEIAPGNTVLVKPGARIPVDGTVSGGAFLRRSGDHHRRIHACGEERRKRSVCGHDQSIGRA